MGFLGRPYPHALSAALVVLLLLGQPGLGAAPADQNSFSEAGPLENPVPLAPEVLKVLLETDAAKEGLAYATAAQRANPAQLFRAAQVHLSQADEVNLVVIGICPMCGADNAWFWVIGSATKNPRIILVAGGKELQLLDSSSKGYRDIQSVWSSPSETDTSLYHFNGVQYELRKRKSTRNHP